MTDPGSGPAGGWPPPPVVRPRPRRRRWVLPLLVVVAAAVLAGGVVVAVRAYTRTAGPDGAVRGYLDALARGDAGTALAYGDIPAGPRTFLTGDVLRAQQRRAPLQGITVTTVDENGDRARVRARYRLGFAGTPIRADVTVGVHRAGRAWRLDEVVVPTQVQVAPAAQRATLAGSAVPEGTVLLFPGAVPVDFDTAYLRATPGADVVSFDSGATTQVDVTVSPAGTSAALAAVRTAVLACLGGASDLRCPLPSERYVPGSVRGTLAAPLGDGVSVGLATSAVGVLEIRGTVSVHGGYRRLEFDNRLTTGRDTTFSLPLRAQTYLTVPLAVTWLRP